MFAPAFPPTNGEETWLSVLDDSWESAGTILSAKDDDAKETIWFESDAKW